MLVECFRFKGLGGWSRGWEGVRMVLKMGKHRRLD